MPVNKMNNQAASENKAKSGNVIIPNDPVTQLVIFHCHLPVVKKTLLLYNANHV